MSSPPAPQATPLPPSDSALPPAAAAASHAAVTDAADEAKGGDKTVFDSPTDFNVKHPLYAPWTLWFDSASKQDKAKSWDDQLNEVVTFQSVEDFWG